MCAGFDGGWNQRIKGAVDADMGLSKACRKDELLHINRKLITIL